MIPGTPIQVERGLHLLWKSTQNLIFDARVSLPYSLSVTSRMSFLLHSSGASQHQYGSASAGHLDLFLIIGIVMRDHASGVTDSREYMRENRTKRAREILGYGDDPTSENTKI